MSIGLYGGSWIFNHVQRVLNLIKIIGADINYDEEAIWYATYLHDWGACPQFNPEKVELGHELRSGEQLKRFFLFTQC